MPKINVYLPDELAEAVRASGVPVSSICQRALEEAVRDVRGMGLDPMTVPGLERFTDRARKVVAIAATAANAETVDVGSEHVLVGLIEEGSGVGAKALAALGITAGAVVAAGQTRSSIADGRDVYRASLKEALKLGHNYVGTEHLLLGIAETNCSARDILNQLGANRGAVKHQVMLILTSASAAPHDAPDLRSTLDEIKQRLDAVLRRMGLTE